MGRIVLLRPTKKCCNWLKKGSSKCSKPKHRFYDFNCNIQCEVCARHWTVNYKDINKWVKSQRALQREKAASAYSMIWWSAIGFCLPWLTHSFQTKQEQLNQDHKTPDDAHPKLNRPRWLIRSFILHSSQIIYQNHSHFSHWSQRRKKDIYI